MSYTLTVRDESATGQALGELSLDFLTERVTVRELIRSRVYQEVKDHNVRAAQAANPGSADFADGTGRHAFRGLVQPTAEERALNGPRALRPARQIDWQKQYEVAVEAFERNGFLILVDEKQLKRLDEEIAIGAGMQVSFVKLVPLVGG
jgi:hypothetical protein